MSFLGIQLALFGKCSLSARLSDSGAVELKPW